MLTVIFSEYEVYNESTNKIITFPPIKIELEHSLASLYKWESQYHVPFLYTKFTPEQYEYYIQCMILNTPKEPTFMLGLTKQIANEIQNYISNSMTATTISTYSNNKKSTPKSIITAEVIYSQMITYNIPFECQYWHLNKLQTLIKVCDALNSQDKLSVNEIMQRNSNLNEQRKAKYHTKG